MSLELLSSVPWPYMKAKRMRDGSNNGQMGEKEAREG